MDDGVSDDNINTVSSDDDEDSVRGMIDDDDVLEAVHVDGGASDADGHESSGNDEVVVVDENVVDLVEESDDLDEASEADDAGGSEEEGRTGTTVAASATPPASAAHPYPGSVSAQQPQSPLQSENPEHPEQYYQENIPHPSAPVTSTSADNDETEAASAFAGNPVLGHSSSQSAPVPGPSVSQSQNTSMDDFQTPVLHRPVAASVILAAASSNESVVEFRSPKRRRVMSPVKAKSSNKGEGKLTEADDNDGDDDGNCCSICFEPWDNSGKHRLSSLKCGHLFGLGCIEKWLKGQGGKCPSCNETAKMKDIRVIYAKAIKMLDTTERDRALQELEKEKELRRHAELEAAQVRLQCQKCMEESRNLREEVDRLRGELSSLKRCQTGGGVPLSQASRTQPSHSQQLRGQFVHEKSIKIWEGGQCRVLAYCPSMAALVISQPSANHLFPGFGIKKLSCLDFKTASYLTLHQKAVRAVSFHQTVDDGILLSVSMDKTVKLTSIITNSAVQTYSGALPLWSCEWNAENQNYFYVGQQNGRVLEFDTRNTSAHLRELNSEGSQSPVVALQYMSRDINAAFKAGGLIVGQLDRVSFFESKADSENRLHILPLEGNLTSLSIDAGTRHLLASFRPTAKHPSVRHQLCELTSTNNLGGSAVSCNVVHTYHGGRSQTVLGKTMLLPHPADDSRLLVVAGDEPSQSAQLWETGTSQLVQRLPCQGMPVDFATFSHNNHTFLAALTDKTLKLHSWN